MKEIKGLYNTAKIFASTIEPSCEMQILELCNQYWVQDSSISIMADCHSGKGCVIGTTMTIKDKVAPNVVGVDGSCGMLTVMLGNINLNLKQLDDIIKNNIPMGTNNRQHAIVDFTEDWKSLYCKDYINPVQVSNSLGSLGSGNHFIEIDVDDDGCKYLVIHTGSRNFGKRVAEYYQEKAIEYHKLKDLKSTTEIIQDLKDRGLKQSISSELAKREISNKDLCYLEGDLFSQYLHDMVIVREMATLNRALISDIICSLLNVKTDGNFETIHNYIDINNMILRKGAISARLGERCLIPINMRDGSLICIGKGNPEYNFSAPHGAGRLMSRTEAKKKLSLDDFKNTMKDVYSSSISLSTLDESPDVYKPMAEILDNIKDTVQVIKHIKPIYNIKAQEE